ncbi:MAG: RagB/SusD family nutrient uptake outer membrane protein [Alistipes sp.]|nr:RagB/SusD family nutrient uptake outer membrane protein [Alistipes sp.]
MKTNTIVRLIAALLCSSVLMTSCIKEGLPQGGSATNEQVGESPFAAGGVLTSMPTIMMTNYLGLGDHVDFGLPTIFGATDRMIGEVFPTSANMPDGNQYYDRWQPWLYFDYAALNDTGWGAKLAYYNYYNFIYTANSAITIFSTNPGPELGVAKAFRAFCFLDLARMYDPLPAKAEGVAGTNNYVIPAEITGLTVPIVTETSTIQELENNPRATREAMFEFILGDLTEAETLLAEYRTPSIGLPSLAVVYGLKARAYNWLGGFNESYENVPTGNEAYKLAAQYARKAITASGCSIMTEAQFTDPVTGFCKVNSAWMWGLQQSTDTVLNNLLSWTAHMATDALWGYGGGAQPGISAISYARMNDTDFRKKLYNNPERDFSKIDPYTNLTEEEYEGGGSAMSSIAPYASFKFHTNNGEKYDYSVGNVTDIPMMRVEEMYFIEAEATAHYDATKGAELLTTFMAHRDSAYAIPAGGDLIEEIIFQKRMEFWGEGIMYFDMKRLNYGINNGVPESNSPQDARYTTNGRAPWWNFVIPHSAVQQNQGLTGMNNPNAANTYLSKNK